LVAKVAYLFGAGSTKAEMNKQGFFERTLLKDLCSQVQDISRAENGKYDQICSSMGIPPDQDIEIMISLFESGSKVNADFEPIVRELRRLYRLVLIRKIANNNIKPLITGTVLHLHSKYAQFLGENGEQLVGTLTLNNDSLIDHAFDLKQTYNGLNYSYPFSSKEFKSRKKAPPLLKLHGSFNWRIDNTSKLSVSPKFEVEKARNFTGWIAPSIFKTPDQIPVFTRIWKVAEKILAECDILRVIGCSLRKEDIHVLSLLFRSQIKTVLSGKKPYQIELLSPLKSIQGSRYEPGIIQNIRFLSKPKSPNQLYALKEDFDKKQENIYNYWVDKMVSWIEKKGARIQDDDFIQSTFYGGNTP
jgi:hypothetical protein